MKQHATIAVEMNENTTRTQHNATKATMCNNTQQHTTIAAEMNENTTRTQHNTTR
jgi:hypothetical protein